MFLKKINVRNIYLTKHYLSLSNYGIRLKRAHTTYFCKYAVFVPQNLVV